MLEHRPESETFPERWDVSRYGRYLVLAPHADDEVFGCGGLMALARAQGAQVRALVVTDGSQSHPDTPAHEVTNQRQQEARAAAQVLGHEVVFLAFKDRGLRYGEELIKALTEAMQAYGPDLVLCTPPTEPHPDHQSLGLAAMAAVMRLPRRPDLAWYESGHLMVHATHVCDITTVAERKTEAMHCFVSQQSLLDYTRCIEAKDRFRSITLGGESRAAEAYHLMPTAGLGERAVLPGLDTLYMHHRQRAASPADVPLVSVLMRTMGDPRLEEAVASVLAQTYRPLELVVVAAHAEDVYTQFPQFRALPCLKVVNLGRRLNRPEAANAALDAATGQYAVFLDEDDWLGPEHVALLVDVLRRHPQVGASRTHAIPLESSGQNPLRGVMLRVDWLREWGCRFESTEAGRENANFWTQVCCHTKPAISSVDTVADRRILLSMQQRLAPPEKALVQNEEKTLAARGYLNSKLGRCLAWPLNWLRDAFMRGPS
ncbi:PIG-L family deacetylase [Hydrogenophaga defluvii]|uniref:PIG-L family deacetylase n=1 Tax=Hydrogenophaga defluvii TaxID=249410 RepID=A0ABW2S995_9BURK